MIDGIGEVAAGIDGLGDARFVYSLTHDPIRRNTWPAFVGEGTIVFSSSITGIGASVSGTEGNGDIGYVFSVTGNGETSSGTDGLGSITDSESIQGIGELGLYNAVTDPNTGLVITQNVPSVGEFRTVFSVAGIGEVQAGTEGLGDIGFGDILGHGEIAQGVEGSGTVELVANIAATATAATLEQINEKLQEKLQETVSVTFAATAYDQRADHMTLFVLQDIYDNWANYPDLKNGSDIDWGVADGTILTMTQAEFNTFAADTKAAWRDRADRVMEKARDWANSGVALSVIEDDSNWA